MNDMTDPSLRSKYYNAALNIQTSLSNPTLYLANPSPNTPTDGILLHGTYSVPFNVGIDTSLIWGDYYFIQGCYRAMNPPAQVTNVSATAPASTMRLTDISGRLAQDFDLVATIKPQFAIRVPHYKFTSLPVLSPMRSSATPNMSRMLRSRFPVVTVLVGNAR